MSIKYTLRRTYKINDRMVVVAMHPAEAIKMYEEYYTDEEGICTSHVYKLEQINLNSTLLVDNPNTLVYLYENN